MAGRKERYTKWAQDYQEFLKSGMTQLEWCDENGISVSTFRYRASHLKNQLEAEAAELSIEELLGDEASDSDDIILEMDGKRIIIGSSVTEDRLKVIISEFLAASR